MVIVDYFSTWSDDTLGRIHLVFAMTALIVGPVIFFTKKGTGWHRMLGYLFITAMLAVNVSALFKYDFSGTFNFFHFAAVASLATLVPAIGFLVAGIRTGKTFYLGIHGGLMGWTYFGLVMAAIAETVTRGFPYLLHGEGGWTRFITTLTIFMIVTGYLTLKFMRKRISLILEE